MKLVISKPIVIAAYELLRACPPFLGWKLPDSSAVEFKVTNSPHMMGECDGETIEVSARMHGSLATLLVTVSHEMIHLYQHIKYLDTKNTVHNADFKRRLAKVCATHGFDEKAAL